MPTGSIENVNEAKNTSSTTGNIISSEQILSNDEIAQAVKFLNESGPRIQRNEQTVNQWSIVLIASVIVLIVTVGGLVVSNIYYQVQTINTANDRISNSLDNIDEKINEIEDSISN